MQQHQLFEFAQKWSYEWKQKVRALQMSRFRWLLDIPVSWVFGRNLRALATIYGSDKWNTHWYAQHYESHFAPVRRRSLILLEIGIGGYDDPRLGGGSLRMWRTYFPNARIHGIDICDKSLHSARRIITHQGSQIDFNFLEGVIAKIGTTKHHHRRWQP